MPSSRRSPNERLLDTARQLFYAEGIHAVGVDRLVREAGVTRATFYRHYPSKEDLVEAYLRAVDADLRTAVEAALDVRDPALALKSLVDLISATTAAPGFRGCHFVNAAAEYPDGTHPVRVAISDHRAWFQAVSTRIAEQLGHPDPTLAGVQMVLLHDGALAAAQLDDPETVRPALVAGAERLLGSRGVAPAS